MVRKNFCVLILFLLLESCFNYYYIKQDKNKERIVDAKLYSFNQKISFQNSKIIDTTCLYLEMLYSNSSTLEKENPRIIIFHNDGTYESRSKKYFNIIHKKNSVYYGGRFILDGNDLRIESFYPSTGEKTNYFVKVISKGKINNDTLLIETFNYNRIYIKRKYRDVFDQ